MYYFSENSHFLWYTLYIQPWNVQVKRCFRFLSVKLKPCPKAIWVISDMKLTIIIIIIAISDGSLFVHQYLDVAISSKHRSNATLSHHIMNNKWQTNDRKTDYSTQRNKIIVKWMDMFSFSWVLKWSARVGRHNNSGLNHLYTVQI